MSGVDDNTIQVWSLASESEYKKPSSFGKLPTTNYKYVLTPDQGRNMKYRVLPSFISIRQGADFNSHILPGTTFSYYLDKEYIKKGFEFKSAYYNGAVTLYKKGVSRHTAVEYMIRHFPWIPLLETTANGEIYIDVNYSVYGSISIGLDNYEISFKAPKNVHRANIDDIIYEFDQYNYTGNISWYLPDMGGRLK